LHEREGVVRDLVHKLDTLVVRGMVDATLEHATPMTVSGYLHTVRSDSIIDELEDVSLVTGLTAAIRRLTWLSSGTSLFKHFWMTWLPFKSLMSTTTCRLSATIMEWICE
jgi:hypothetical protein